MAHGKSVGRPHNSPLIKLPKRPNAKPNGTKGAIKSVTSKKLLLFFLPNQNMATRTPMNPPWKDIPPSHTLKTSRGLAR